MTRAVRAIVIAVVVGVSLAACLPGAPVGLRTAAAPAQACMDALMVGTLARHPLSGLGITSADGQSTPVEWPFGYTARGQGGRIVLVDPSGTVVAREGDEIQVGGGFGTNFWHACGPVSVAVPAG